MRMAPEVNIAQMDRAPHASVLYPDGAGYAGGHHSTKAVPRASWDQSKARGFLLWARQVVAQSSCRPAGCGTVVMQTCGFCSTDVQQVCGCSAAMASGPVGPFGPALDLPG